MRTAEAFDALEELLALMRPKADTKALMETLRSRFVSPGALFGADQHVLTECGLSESDALLIANIQPFCRYMARDDYEKRPQLGRLHLASEYLIDCFYALREERFYMLCLDARGRLAELVFLQEGTQDSALFSLRNLLGHVMRTSPAAVVLSHNHPRGTLNPSHADLVCTQDAIRALTAVGIPLLDHIIVAGDQAVSIRDNGFFEEAVWRAQAPGNRLLDAFLKRDLPQEALRHR